MLRFLSRAGVLFLVALVFGCGSADPVGTIVSGQVMEKGTPVRISTQGLPPGDKGFTVILLPLDSSKPDRFNADVTPEDGSFTVKGPKGKGIPAGKYRITITRGAMGKQNPADQAFGPTNSPLTFEVPASGSLKVKVDLDSKQVTPES
jgi:hypothetical protein